MRDLQRLAKRRHEEEQRLHTAYEKGLRNARKAREDARRPALANYEQDKAAANEVDARQREFHADDHERVTKALKWEYQRLRTELEAERKEIKDRSLKKLDEGTWQIRSIHDAQKDIPSARRDEANSRLAELRSHLEETELAVGESLSGRLLGFGA